MDSLPGWRRGDSIGPWRFGPVSPDTPLPYPLAEAVITCTFRQGSALGEITQVLTSTAGEIEIDGSGRIVIKRFSPRVSGKLVWDLQLEWPDEGEVITVYQSPERWTVALDISRPEGAR